MLIGSFGAKKFEVSSSKMITFESLDLSGSLSVSTQDAAGKKPVTTIKGPALAKLSLTMKLNASLGVDVRAEIDAWREMMEAGKAYPFILCGKAISLNRFLLTSCKAGSFVIGQQKKKALILMADLSLEFSEYLPPGAQAVSSKGGAGSGAGGGAGGSSLRADNPYQMPSSAEKAEQKRSNPGMKGE